jgi:hypothetical protein
VRVWQLERVVLQRQKKKSGVPVSYVLKGEEMSQTNANLTTHEADVTQLISMEQRLQEQQVCNWVGKLRG